MTGARACWQSGDEGKEEERCSFVSFSGNYGYSGVLIGFGVVYQDMGKGTG